ncbi:phosphoserine phosphatase SerB [Rothia nasimurium]|uniref:phosphoserine phosphatase SerB n=1 Tax=Rothia nasimurium TaxID=85336 RepID=UPI001F012C67|nr:phosphoserine phosphatase SerB [Rothia nasimurium]
MSTSVNIVAISRADAPLIATEEQLVAALQTVEGLELESGLLMEVPASRVEREAEGPAYSVYIAAASWERGGVEDARGALGLLDGARSLGFDLNVVPAELANDEKKLLIMDVDSTLIRQEVIDELAAAAGRGAEVAEVTERAMRGELDFEASLRERVATLAGLDESVIDEVASKVLYSPGATKLVEVFLAAGHEVCVVSGGFVQVLSPLAGYLNLSKARANVLDIIEGKLTGKVTGEVITGEVKKESLKEWAKEFDIKSSQTIAVGDGANDVLMILEAELGVAFNAKTALLEVADAQINTLRLDAVRHFAGL